MTTQRTKKQRTGRKLRRRKPDDIDYAIDVDASNTSDVDVDDSDDDDSTFVFGTQPETESDRKKRKKKELKQAIKEEKKAKRKELKQAGKVRVLKKYPDAECIMEGCTRKAVGAGDVCARHGGDAIIEENLLTPVESALMPVRTKYNGLEHPIQYVTLSAEGMSDVEVAAEFGVSVGTIRRWAEKHSEFHQAYEIGKAMHEAWWLREGKDNLDNRGYNVGLFKFLTSNKLGYSDKMESKNLNVNAGVLLVPGQMTESDWEKDVAKD